MFYEILSWFATNHNHTHLSLSQFAKYKMDLVHLSDDKEVQEFTNKYGHIKMLWEIHDYDQTPVGFYLNYVETLNGVSSYLDDIKGEAGAHRFANTNPELDTILAEIHTLMSGDTVYELHFCTNDNNAEYRELTDYLNNAVKKYGRDYILQPNGVVQPTNRLLDVYLYKYDNLDNGSGKNLYRKAGLLSLPTLTTMLTDILATLKADVE